MRVRDRMTKDLVCVDKDTSISDALYLMQTNHFHRLPIVEKGKLIGLITEGTIASNSPTSATSLSIYELNYLLSKTKVEDIMIKEVFTIAPEAFLEEAAVLMRKNNVGCLPVIEKGELVGLITQNDIFDSFVDLLGYYTQGYRYIIEVKEDHPGVLSTIASIFFQAEANITNLAVYHKPDCIEIVIRASEVDPQAIQEQLSKLGYRVSYSN